MLVAAALCAAVGGCAVFPSSTDAAYPVFGNPVNPTPLAGYRIQCDSVPAPTNALFDDYNTGCRQLIVPAEAVVEVRG